MSEISSANIYRFKVGRFDCIIIQDMGMTPALSQFFPDIPQDEARELAAPYHINVEAIDLSINILLVRTPDHLVLIDTGTGQSSLSDKIKSAGIDPAAIDTVVLTHGHSDHVGGIFDAVGNFNYPNAHYFMWQGEYDHWTGLEQPPNTDLPPAIVTMQKLHDQPGKLTLIGATDQEVEIVPGVCAIFAPGHTPGHLAIVVESGADKLLHIVDAAHVPLQITHPEWSMRADTDKVQSATTRKTLFDRALHENLLLMAYHFTFPGLGHVTADDVPWSPIKRD